MKFQPTTAGNKTGTVTITTNDQGGTRSSFGINLTGTATLSGSVVTYRFRGTTGSGLPRFATFMLVREAVKL